MSPSSPTNSPMDKFNRSVLDIVGHTPIIKLQHTAKQVTSSIYVKLEYLNPGGSIKDRIGKYMCEQALKKGTLKPGGTIVEATSGNTGIGIAMFAAINNMKAIFVMADKQSKEKIDVLRAFGAEVIICPTRVEHDDPRSYYSIAQKIADTIPNCFYANQYDNDDNAKTHYYSTGPEIYNQTLGDFDYFVAGVGTGGTISGTSKFLKEKMKHLKTIGVDLKGSILSHYHETGKMIEPTPYAVEGVGSSFIPHNVDFKVIDEFVVVDDKESFETTRILLNREAIYCGGSCGSVVAGALKHAAKQTSPKKYLVILPDTGSRYLSKVYNNDWLKTNGFNPPEENTAIRKTISALIIKDVKLI